jgi:uncharacterized metal-binding protein (TIGR02443 family)
MSEQKITKRFIAGAVCPRCSEMDKLVMFLGDDQQQVRECVRCGYRDVMTDNGPVQQAIEVTTRVNQPRLGEQSLAHEDDIQLVTIVEPGKSSPAANKPRK